MSKVKQTIHDWLDDFPMPYSEIAWRASIASALVFALIAGAMQPDAPGLVIAAAILFGAITSVMWIQFLLWYITRPSKQEQDA